MSLLGKKLSIPVLENSNIEDDYINISGANFDYCIENYGDITLEEELYMDQISIIESFHELDCIENAYYNDISLMESASVDYCKLQEREALFEADQEGAKRNAIQRLRSIVESVISRVKGLYSSIINFLQSKFTIAGRLVNKYGNIISQGSCSMECYEFKDVGPNNKGIQSLKASNILKNLYNVMGCQLESAIKKSPDNIKSMTDNLNKYRSQLRKFDHDEIVDELRGKKITRTINGKDVIQIIKDKNVITGMKREINDFDKVSYETIKTIKNQESNASKGINSAEATALVAAYTQAFTSHSQITIKIAKCVVEVAQEKYKFAILAAKKIVADSNKKYNSNGSEKEGQSDSNSENKKESYNKNDSGDKKENVHDEFKKEADELLNEFGDKKTETLNNIKDRHKKAAKEVKKSLDDIYSNKKSEGSHEQEFKEMSNDLDDLLKD